MPLSICRVATGLAGALVLAISVAASAATFSEVGDASNLFDDGAGPQDAGVGTDTVLGAITPGDTGDLFKLSLDTGVLTLTATRTGGVLDPQIYLFDALGQGIASNDNANASTTGAVLVLPILAGTYYLGIGHALTVAIDRSPGTPKTWSGTPLPPFDWTTLGSLESGIPQEQLSLNMYRFEWTYKAPEPGTLVLMVMALAGALVLQRRAVKRPEIGDAAPVDRGAGLRRVHQRDWLAASRRYPPIESVGLADSRVAGRKTHVDGSTT